MRQKKTSKARMHTHCDEMTMPRCEASQRNSGVVGHTEQPDEMVLRGHCIEDATHSHTAVAVVPLGTLERRKERLCCEYNTHRRQEV